MSNEQLLVTLGIKDAGATKQISALNKELRYLEKESKIADKATNGFQKSQEGLESKLRNLNQRYDATNSKLDAYKRKMDEANKNIERKKNELDELKKSEDDNTKAIQRAESQLATYQSQLRESERNINLTEQELSQLTKQIDNTNNSLVNFKIDSFNRKMQETKAQIDAVGDKFISAGNRVTSFGSKMTLGITMPLAYAGKKAFEYASDMDESVNKVEATFGEHAKTMQDFAKTSLQSYGIATSSALEYGATSGDILKGIGFDMKVIPDMSKEIIAMSADIASFKNSSPEEVFSAITAALTGEREQLKKYGYVINDAILQEYAHAKGINKKLSEMSLQEKATLTLSKIQEYAADAQGDYAKTSDSASNSSKLFKESTKELFTVIGTDLVPIFTPLIQQATEMIKTFASMDDESRQNIVKFGLMVAAAPPLIMAIGKVTSTTGSLIKVFGGLVGATGKAGEGLKSNAAESVNAATKTGILSKATSLLNPTMLAVAGTVAVAGTAIAVMRTESELTSKSLTTAKDDLSGFEKTVATFTGKVFESREELEKNGLVHKQFSDEISPELQEQIKNSTMKVQEFNVAVREMNLTEGIDEAEANKLKETVNGAINGAVETINTRKEEILQGYRESFGADGVISEEEQKILDVLGIKHEEQKMAVKTLGEDINAIIQNANAEKRALTQEEIKSIEDKNAEIFRIETEAQAKTEQELIYAKSELSNRLKTMSMEEASALAQEKATQRNSEISETTAFYDSQILGLQSHLNNLSGEERIAFENQILDLENQKQQKIEMSQKEYDDFMGIIDENNPLLLEKLNYYNGLELTQADVKAQTMLVALKGQYDDMNTVTEDGTYLMYNKFTNAMDNITVAVDEGTGEITGVYSEASNKWGGYSEQMASKVKELGSQFGTSAKDTNKALNEMKNATVTNTGQIVDENGKTITSLQDLKRNADGTKEGILNLNGEPIKVKTNADGVITDLGKIKEGVNKIPSSKDIYIKYHYSEVGRSSPYSSEPNKPKQSTPVFRSIPEQEPYTIQALLSENEATNLLKTTQFSGGYFSQKSNESQAIKNTVQQTRVQATNSLDAEKIGQIVAQAITTAIQGLTLQGDVRLDNGAIVGAVSNGIAINSKRRR